MSDKLTTLQSIAKSMRNPVIQWAAAEIARLRGVADGTTQSRVADDIAVEAAWERCGIRPHWPDDEAGSVVRHAESMAMEIARLREERLTNEERGAISWARAGLLNDADETKARGLRERSEYSREAAETLTQLLERHPLPPGQETNEAGNE